MYDDNFDLWNGEDVSDSDVPIVEDPGDDVSSNDSVSDPWLDPILFRKADVSSNDSQEVDTLVEVDLTQIEDSLQSIDKYFNLLLGIIILYIGYRAIRGIVYRFNTKGKGIDE